MRQEGSRSQFDNLASEVRAIGGVPCCQPSDESRQRKNELALAGGDLTPTQNVGTHFTRGKLNTQRATADGLPAGNILAGRKNQAPRRLGLAKPRIR